MRKILFGLLMMLAVGAIGQQATFNHLNTRNSLQIPRYSSLANATAAGARSGNLVFVYQGVDSGFYVRRFDNATWKRVDGAGGGGAYTAGSNIQIVGSIIQLPNTISFGGALGTASLQGGLFIVNSASGTTSLQIRGTGSTHLAEIFSTGTVGEGYVPLFIFRRTFSGNPNTTAGGALRFLVQNIEGDPENAAEIRYGWKSVAVGAHVGRIFLRARSSGVDYDVIEAAGNGRIVFPQGLPDFTDDAAAAAGGVEIGGLYRTGSVVKIRVS